MGRLIGYARVSTIEQDLQLQLDALNKAGCAISSRTRRPELVEAVQGWMRAWPRWSRAIRWWSGGWTGWDVRCPTWSLSVEELLGKGIGFRSLLDGAIDTTTASGELMFNIFSSLAQFERRLIQERTQAGLAAARARGRLGGRRPISPNDPRVVTAKRLHRNRSLSIDHICATLGISRPTFYRYPGITRKRTVEPCYCTVWNCE